MIFVFDTKSIVNKSKNNKVGLYQTKKVLAQQKSHQQNIKATY